MSNAANTHFDPLVRPVLAAVMAVLGASASAVTHAADEPVVTELTEITVTGSRVKPTENSAPTPITTLGAEQLQVMGATDVASGLNQMMPSLIGSSTPTTSTLGVTNTGANFLNLRNLGTNRTLVLIDGHRHVPTTDTGVVDINVIPQVLIDRVEVVTGGASAAWGSDAVAGVVNIITKHRFNGFELGAQGGVTDYGDDESYRATLLYGSSMLSDRGHITIAGELYDNKGILRQDSRPWGRVGYGIIPNPDFAPGNGEYQQLLGRNVRLALATEGGLILGGPLNGTHFGVGGVPLTFTAGEHRAALTMEGGDGASMGKYTNLDTPVHRANLYVSTDYEITDSLQASLAVSYASSRSKQKIVQPFNFANITINADNAFLPSSIADQMSALSLPAFTLSRLDTDFGFITADNDISVARIVGGLEGKISDNWSWDASYEYGRTRYSSDALNSLNLVNMGAATDAVLDPGTGRVVCRSTLTDASNGCVPINLFGYGSPSSQALDYVLGTQNFRARYTQSHAALTVHGTPFSSWAGPVNVAAGIEYRRDTGELTTDAVSLQNVYLTGFVRPLNGALSAKEAFAEAVIPLLKDLPFAQSAALDIGVRQVDYQLSGSETTWKAGLTLDPTDEFRIRASRSRDVRAPNINELFSPGRTTFITIIDPDTLEQLQVTSVTQPNLDLQAEKADTTTAGFTFTPRWLTGARLSIDYYDVVVNGAVATLDEQDIVDRCASGNTPLCDFIQRDGTGTIVSLTPGNINLSTLKTRGYEAEIAYVAPLDRLVSGAPGNLALRVLGNYVKSLTYDDGINSRDFAGDVGGDLDTPMPHFKGSVSAVYEVGNWSTYLGGRYVGGGYYDHTLGELGLDENHVTHQFLTDASVGYTFGERDAQSIRTLLSVSNLFNKDPPIAPTSFVAPLASNPALYDPMGRVYRASVVVRF